MFHIILLELEVEQFSISVKNTPPMGKNEGFIGNHTMVVEQNPVLVERREPPNFFAKSTLSVLESIGNSDILF